MQVPYKKYVHTILTYKYSANLHKIRVFLILENGLKYLVLSQNSWWTHLSIAVSLEMDSVSAQQNRVYG